MNVWIVEHMGGSVHGVKSVHYDEASALASIRGTWTKGQGDASQEWFITIGNQPYRLFRMSVEQRAFSPYDGWTDDLHTVVVGGASSQTVLDAAVQRLRATM